MSGEKKPYFPMFVDLSDKKVVVLGAGTIAKRRIRSMIEFTDHLVVIAPEVNPELRQLEEEGKLMILRKPYDPEDICDAALVIAATNDKKINQEIYDDCQSMGIPVNVYKDKSRCDFYFPGLITQGSLVVGVNSNGREKKQSKEAVEKIRRLLEEE